MGGDTNMELGFPATPLSAVPGICPERGVQPARQPSFAFGEGGFGTLNIAAFGRRCAIKRLYRTAGCSYAKTSSLAHRQWALTDIVKQWLLISARRGGDTGLPIASVR